MFLNKVTLVGFLGRDPMVRRLSGGSLAVKLNVATSYRSKVADGGWVSYTEWHRVKAYGRLAEVAAAYLRKGRQVYLEGKLKTESWQDRSGKEFSWVVVEADQIVMLDRPEEVLRDGESSEHTDMSWLEADAPQPARTHTISEAEIPF